MKKTFIWIGTVVGAAAFMTLVFGALEKRGADVRTISVRGECMATAPKDKVAITLRVTTLADTAVDSMRDATNQMAQITEYLKNLPVEIQTTQFNSYEKSEWNRETQKSVTLGIETTIAAEVSATSIDVIEGVLGQFAGVKNVYSENLRMYTSPSVMQPVIDKCLGVATQNARLRADALAQGDGVRAGKILAVSYGTDMSDVVRPVNGLMRAKMVSTEAMVDAAGSIVATDTQVSVAVDAVFEIK